MPRGEEYYQRLEFDDPRLGRHIRRDPRSWDYAYSRGLQRGITLPSSSFRLRLWNPVPTPNQRIGNCTGVDQCVKMNVQGNRRTGVILDMARAEKIYSRATQLDPWPGSWPPTDTGSSGLAACKASVEFGEAERYEWIFNGADGVLAALVDGHAVGVGTRWDRQMFTPDDGTYLVHPGGTTAGGHEWSCIGYNRPLDAIEGLCWWGAFGMYDRGIFRIKRTDLDALLDDQGDAHVVYRAGATG